MRYADLLYPTADAWSTASHKRLLFFGMSGLGKTHLANMLRAAGGWFHYSVDYRIGTRYMGELITDSFKREAMQVPYLAELLKSDSIYIASNITFNNLAPLSTYLGKPGDPNLGGLPLDDYRARQEAHRRAEIAALLDTPRFITRAEDLYGYQDFVCDSGGSICEVVEPTDPTDHVLTHLAQAMLLVWIKGSEAHAQELARRFDAAPKPMYYQPAFLTQCWAAYLAERNIDAARVDPDDFVRFTYARALAARQPRYAAMAQHWGITVTAEEVADIRDAQGLTALISRAIDRAQAGQDPGTAA